MATRTAVMFCVWQNQAMPEEVQNECEYRVDRTKNHTPVATFLCFRKKDPNRMWFHVQEYCYITGGGVSYGRCRIESDSTA